MGEHCTHLPSGEGGVEGVNCQDVLQEGNCAVVATARHKLDANVDWHVGGIRECEAVVKRRTMTENLCSMSIMSPLCFAMHCALE